MPIIQEMTENELEENDEGQKRVSWSNVNRVILVPCRREYISAGICDDLWWQRTDFIHFRKEAVADVSSAMSALHLDVKGALQYLFQYEYDESFKDSSTDRLTSPPEIARSFSFESEEKNFPIAVRVHSLAFLISV
jgi:hypothetical protein